MSTKSRDERRRTHGAFKRTLARIAGRVANDPVFRIRWRNELLGRDPRESTIRVRALWVAGSFARGARTCGDLDLIADVILEDGFHPGERQVARAVIGTAVDVSLYVGTPEKNASGVAFPEARRVWAETEPAWETALALIREDTSATRFDRKIDQLPFRAEQLAPADKPELESIVDLHAGDILAWEFVPLERIGNSPDHWPPGAQKCAERLFRSTGRKTADALRVALGYVVEHARCIDWDEAHGERVTFRIGPYEVRTGRPGVAVDALDDLNVFSILIVPHHSRRGPNGVWSIQRGPHHRVERLFASASAWYHRSEDGCAAVAEWDWSSWRDAKVLQLFESRKQAHEQAQLDREELGDHDRQVECVAATGTDLLRLIAGVDAVDLPDWRLLPLTITGVLLAKEVQAEAGEDVIATPEHFLEELGAFSASANG